MVKLLLLLLAFIYTVSVDDDHSLILKL